MSLSQSKEIAAPVADDVKTDRADGHAGAHAVPRRILLAVYGALLLFTVITVGVSTLNLGQFNIWVALMVAVIKGGLVAMYFMHLRWDSPFNGLILVAALFFVALFIGIAMLDAHTYEPNLQPPLNVIIPQYVDVKGAAAPVPDNGPTIATLDGAPGTAGRGTAGRTKILNEVAAMHGDVYEGERLFNSTQLNCFNCHSVRKSDPLKGPCLVDVAKKYNRRDLAEQILDPSLKIAEGFETHHYKLDDEITTKTIGSTSVIEGFLVRQTPDKIVLRLITGEYVTIDPSNVEKSKIVPISPMPEGVVGSLTVRQFASVLDYLQALSGVK